MASKLTIYNLAFAHLGEATVTSLTDDPPQPNVTKANAQWDAALDEALARAGWLCALESPVLDPVTAPPEGWGDWRYPYRFECPNGTLKVWNVDGGHDFAWQAGTAVDANGAVRRIIKAKVPGPLKVDLVMRRPPEALTPLLVKALGKELAALLAGPIQQNEGKAARLHDAAEKDFLKAEMAEATEIGGQEPMFGDGPMTQARRIAD